MAHYNNPQHPGDPVDRPRSACKLSAEVHEASREQNKDYRGQPEIVTYDCITEVCSMAGEESRPAE